MTEPLWFINTRYIKVQNKFVFYKQMYLKGLCIVCDLLNSDGNFLSQRPDSIH